MVQARRRQPKYRHVAPALALMTTVVVAMAGVTFSRLSHIPAESSPSASPAVIRVRLSGVQRAEATNDVSAPQPARDAAPRVTAAEAEQAPSVSLADAAPPTVVKAQPTLPLSPATLMVGLAAARSRARAATPPKSALATPCEAPVVETAVVENFDADIAGMTGVPGRTMYYARRPQKNAPAPACRRPAQLVSSTP